MRQQRGDQQAQQGRPGFGQARHGRFLGAGFERHGGLGARRFQCRRGAAQQGDAYAECKIDQRAERRKLHLRPHAGEEACAQVAAEKVQRGRGHGIAGRDADRRSGHAEAEAFQHNLVQQALAVHAQHAQQRKLAAAADDGQGLRGEHQEGASKQCHQRQHGQVDAIGAADALVTAVLFFVVGLVDVEAAGIVAFQIARQLGSECVAIDAVAQFQVDAREQT